MTTELQYGVRSSTAPLREVLVGGDVRIVDVPYWKGAAELVHPMSVISPVSDDLAVVLPLLPAGLHEWLVELGVRLVEVPEGNTRPSVAMCWRSGPAS
jgi:N-dimethylarginine dimethylaminohydrolase